MHSILSAASLGRKIKKDYTRIGIHVKRLLSNRLDRTKRYRTCVVPPTEGWYPSKTANFVFRSKSYDPQYLLEFAADFEWNPSIWLHSTSKRYVVRVPKDRERDVRKRLYERGMWYDTGTNLWNRRRRRARKKGYPSFVQSLGAKKNSQKSPFAKKEKAKKDLFFKFRGSEAESSKGLD